MLSSEYFDIKEKARAKIAKVEKLERVKSSEKVESPKKIKDLKRKKISEVKISFSGLNNEVKRLSNFSKLL